MKTRILIIIIFLILLVVVSIYSIVNKDEQEQLQNHEILYETINMVTNLRLGVSEFENIQPYLTNNQEAIYIFQFIFEPLFNLTKDYKIEGCLAKEWSKIDNKTYLIKLNENIKWHDNTTFNANDVKFSITELQKQTKSVYYSNVKNIKNVEIIDEQTINIHLKQEQAFFEYNLIFPIISSKQYKNAEITNTNIVPLGTGKYKISKIAENKIELTKNENWINTNNDSINIQTIYVNLYNTRGEEYNAFKLGSIDLIYTQNENVEEYIGSMGYNKKIYSNREYDFLALNCENTILQYQEVRQAISKIIDKNKIVNSTLENKVTIANYPLINNSYILKNIESVNSANIEKAQEILKNAGWNYEYGVWQKEINGVTKTINIDLIVSKNNSQRVKVAETLKEQLESFGIKVNIIKVTDIQYTEYLNNKNYEMILTGVYTSVAPDLNYFLGKGNLSNYENEDIITNINEINNITDEQILKEKYAKIFGICNEQVPFISLYYNNDMVAYSNNLVGDIEPNCYSIFYNFNNWYRK